MDLDLKLQAGEEIIKVANDLYDKLRKFHDISEEDAKLLEDLIKTDERFTDVEKRMSEIGAKLGM